MSSPAISDLPALTAPPFFVVGCGRSGTTLLRLMLDSHHRLAVPRESRFIVEVVMRRRASDLPTALETILEDERFAHWSLDPERVRSAVERARPRTYAELVRTVFAAYAEAHGKPRWGDKTTSYAAWMDFLADLFPDSRFIHMVRDGRETAVSMAAQREWRPRGLMAAGVAWRRTVTRARSSGRRLGPERYLEVRLEELTARPVDVLRQVCSFLGESYDPLMLDYHRGEHAAAMLSGSRSDHRHVVRPPTAGLRDWRAGLSPGRARLLEAVCQPALADFGYGARAPGIWARVVGELFAWPEVAYLGLQYRAAIRWKGTR